MGEGDKEGNKEVVQKTKIEELFPYKFFSLKDSEDTKKSKYHKLNTLVIKIDESIKTKRRSLPSDLSKIDETTGLIKDLIQIASLNRGFFSTTNHSNNTDTMKDLIEKLNDPQYEYQKTLIADAIEIDKSKTIKPEDFDKLISRFNVESKLSKNDLHLARIAGKGLIPEANLDQRMNRSQSAPEIKNSGR
jgi:hypothetical protein